MGVTGLWQVVEPAGRPVDVQSLRGKVLAVDVSIWLHQLIKGFRDKDGNPLPNAHLLGVFHRVCKLLHYGIKPVFVFDGGVPELKRQTMILRRKRKLQAQDKSEISRQKMLSNYLRQQIQRQTMQALPPTMRMESQIEALSSPKKFKSVSPTKKVGSILVAASSSSKVGIDDVFNTELQSFREKFTSRDDEEKEENGYSDSDDPDEYQASYGMDYSDNFSAIVSSDFDALPLETQHEVLFEMQESRKMNSWGKLDKMPQNLQDFSSYQMNRLVKRRFLQKKIQSVQQEMGQRHIHVQNLDDLLKMDYSFDGNSEVIGSQEKGCVLIKTSPKKKKTQGLEDEEPKPGSSSGIIRKSPEVITIDDYVDDGWSSGGSTASAEGLMKVDKNHKKSEGTRTASEIEEDEQLALGIKMSLAENSKDIGQEIQTIDIRGLDPGRFKTPIKLNIENPRSILLDEEPECSPVLKQPSLRPIVASPIKVIKSLQLSQISSCSKFLDTVGFSSKVNTSQSVLSIQKKVPANSDNSDSSDSDFEPVEELPSPKEEDPNEISEKKLVGKLPELTPENGNKLSLYGSFSTIATIKLDEIVKEQPENDIFADIFGNEEKSYVYVSKTSLDSDVQMSEKMEDEDENEAVKWDSEYSDPDIDDFSETEQNPDGSGSGPNKEQEEIDLAKNKLAHEEFLSKFIKAPSKPSSLAPYSNEKITRTLGKMPFQDKVGVKLVTTGYMQAQEKLNSEQDKLQSARGNQERVATSISDQMSVETQELLSLFGIPYIVSPMEAESQCAFLDTACLTEGTITDDSDIWLFNGRRVYKNFYASGGRKLEFYQQADIIKILNLDRDKLVLLAMLMGGDYNEGIEGVGPVTALELISEFPTNSIISFDSLLKFREWWDQAQGQKEDAIVESKVKTKLRKLKLSPGFPSLAVYEAYINPTIDNSTEPFRWGTPDLDSIRSYTKDKFGWEQEKCDGMLLPVMKNLRCQAEQSKQLTMDRFVTFGRLELEKPYKRKKGSKRLHTAVKKLKQFASSSNELNLSSDSDSNSTEETEQPKKLSPKKKKLKSTRKSQDVSSTSSTSKPSTSVTVRIPKPSPVILQKVQEETQRNINKQKAIKLLKSKELKK